MTAREFAEWQEFDAIEPPEDGYWQAAMIASTFARVMGSKDAKLADFLPATGGRSREQTPENMAALASKILGPLRKGARPDGG